MVYPLSVGRSDSIVPAPGAVPSSKVQVVTAKCADDGDEWTEIPSQTSPDLGPVPTPPVVARG
ncbi:hypothetical protein FTUN_2392 [Frigoriglobus tundricola]|uniref:Uncharacterized protein n=1 Tax=Frigoriglobus tundricola TaxID=2774151 RepID=A0A6M5YNF4_9BACT|nr:hypothetical protein FTUN_2392 [Frigoriglobus tundricola]